MAKAFMGVRMRRLRKDRGMTQAALARSLGISASYLNQIEQNQRPLTVPVLLKLNGAFGLDVQLFSDAKEARLITDLRGALADRGAPAAMAELRQLASNMPGVARAIIAMQARLCETSERADLLAGRLTGTQAAAKPAAFESVRDWFYDRRNHVPELENPAEAIGMVLPSGRMTLGLVDRLAGRNGIRIALEAGSLRRFDPGARILHLSPHLNEGQQAFQIATQLAFP